MDPRQFLCKIKLHSWSFVDWADFGRGKLEKCSRSGCSARRRVPVTLTELQNALDEEVKEVRQRPIPDADDAIFEAMLAGMDVREFEIKVFCSRCRRQLRPGQKQCLNPSCDKRGRGHERRT